jgi:hypothetical protein
MDYVMNNIFGPDENDPDFNEDDYYDPNDH